MKIDEELGLDREDEFQKDYEENRAERACSDVHEDDTESDNSFPSRNSSSNCLEVNDSSWPQSYWFSIFLTAFGISFSLFPHKFASMELVLSYWAI